MKKNLTFNSLFSGLLLLIGGAVFTGCNDYDFGVDIAKLEHEKFQASGIFDFATTGAVTLSVDYYAPGANNPIRVYDQYPYNDDGDLVDGLEPVFAFFLKDGKFEGACNLPTATTHVWLEACGIGLPTLREADIRNGVLSFAETRAITQNAYHDTFVGTETVVTDFTEAVWSSSTLISGKVTISDMLDWYGGNGAQIENGTYPGWGASTNCFRTGGKSTIQSGKEFTRVFIFHAPNEGELKVYFTGTGSEQSRSMFISQSITATNRDENTSIGNTGVTTGNSDPAVTTANVTTGDVYIWSDESCRVFKIVFKANNSEELSFADCRKITNYAKISEDGTKYDEIKNHIYPLYPWSMTGRPMFVDETSNTSTNAAEPWKSGTKYHYYYYYDNNGNEQKDGIEQNNKDKNTPKKTEDVSTPVPVPNSYATVDGVGYDTYMDFSRDGAALRIHDTSAGTLRLLMYWTGTLDRRRFSVDEEVNWVLLPTGTWEPLGNSRTTDQYVYEGTVQFKDISETGDSYHTLAKYANIFILFAEYTDVNGTKYSCSFDKNGVVSATPGMFSLADGTQCKTNPNTHNEDQMLPRTVHYTDKNNNGTHTGDYCYYSILQSGNFTFTLPAATQAKLTIVFDDAIADEKKTSFKLNGGSTITSTDNVYEMEIRAGDTDTDFTITKGNGRNVFFIAVDCMDYLQTTDHYQQVKRFAKYDNSALADNAKLPAVTDRLRAFLWKNEISKTKAKEEHGNNFNLELARKKKTDGKADQYIRVIEDAELFVTFLAEYDMRSANAFGYYYYDGSKPKPNREDLDLYIVFPNCTSTDYANSATYKLNGSAKNGYAPGLQELVPLSNGDQVQLVYFDESGNKQEKFPAGTIVGWFLIYNGFDTWNATYNTLTTSWIQLNHQNNNHYSGSTVLPHSIIYYSDPAYTDLDQQVNVIPPYDAEKYPENIDGTGLPRCISVTDAVTGQISLCFEDSYYDPGMSLTKDFTYDDLLFTVTALPSNHNIESPNGENSGEGSTNITYTQKGTYLFEDIWEGDETDFDLNDVAVEYTRVYTINPDNFITSIKETYKVINDGATYDDGFAVKLPYLASSIETISYSKNGSNATNLTLNNTDITPMNNVSRVERDKDYLNLVVFDHINDFADNEISPNPDLGTKYEYVITFKQGSQPSISEPKDVDANHEAGSITFSYGRDSYNPFIIVYTYGNRAQGAGSGDGAKRCEIHMPGKTVSQWGTVPTDSQATNNRWFVAKYGNSSEQIFPFAVDVPIHDFRGCTEGQLVTELYSGFITWASSGGTNNADWYSHPAQGLGGWGERVK